MSIYTYTLMCKQTLTYLVLSSLIGPYICKHRLYKEDVYAYVCVHIHKCSVYSRPSWIKPSALIIRKE